MTTIPPCGHPFARGYTQNAREADGTPFCTACGARGMTGTPTEDDLATNRRLATWLDEPGCRFKEPGADERARLEKLAGDRVDWVCLDCGAFGHGFHACVGTAQRQVREQEEQRWPARRTFE